MEGNYTHRSVWKEGTRLCLMMNPTCPKDDRFQEVTTNRGIC